MITEIKKPLNTGHLEQTNYSTDAPRLSMTLLPFDCLNCDKTELQKNLSGICRKCLTIESSGLAIRVDYHKKHLNYWLKKFRNI